MRGLIEAYWNVNSHEIVLFWYASKGLIEAYWNVNFPHHWDY